MATDKKTPPKATAAKTENELVKAAPYPISCKIETTPGKPPVECQIQRLEDFGFILRSTGFFFRLGHDYVCDFEIPMSKEKIHEVVKVIKTAESAEAYIPNGSKVKVMTVEVHFKNVLGEHRKPIRNFIRKIGQKPPQVPPAAAAK